MAPDISDVFFARVASADVAFNPNIHARSDIVALGAVFSQVRGSAASVNIRCITPEEGLGSGPRWGILSAVIDGELTQIARGEIVSLPLRLAGQEIDIELSCKAHDTSDRVDNLFRARDAEVPDHVEPSMDPRRTAPYLLSDIYVDPITLLPSLDPIAGSAAPALTLYGEGADPDVSTVLAIDIRLTDPPAERVTLTETTDFTHRVWRKIDLGDAMPVRISADDRATYTPLSLREALERITLDGGYELLSTNVEYSLSGNFRVYTKKRTVDPFTCIITPARYVEYRRADIAEMNIVALVEAVQDRRETLQVVIEPAILAIGGAAQLTETSSLQDPDRLAQLPNSMIYQTFRPNPGFGGGTLTTTQFITRYGAAQSVWNRAGAVHDECIPSLHAMIRRAARIAVERAHAVELTIDTFDVAALSLTLRDRVRVYDTRLPGGVAVGKVTGLAISFEGPGTVTSIILSCPVSDPTQLSASIGAGADGLAEVIISEAFESTDPVVHSEQMLAVMNADAGYLVEYMEIIDGTERQELAVGGTNETDFQIEFPEDMLPQTGFAMRLTDLSPVNPDNLPKVEHRLETVIIRLPEGITL